MGKEEGEMRQIKSERRASFFSPHLRPTPRLGVRRGTRNLPWEGVRRLHNYKGTPALHFLALATSLPLSPFRDSKIQNNQEREGEKLPRFST